MSKQTMKTWAVGLKNEYLSETTENRKNMMKALVKKVGGEVKDEREVAVNAIMMILAAR